MNQIEILKTIIEDECKKRKCNSYITELKKNSKETNILIVQNSSGDIYEFQADPGYKTISVYRNGERDREWQLSDLQLAAEGIINYIEYQEI